MPERQADASFPVLDELFELPQSVRDGFTQMEECRNERRKLEELDIAEEYLNGRIVFLVEFESQVRSEFRDSRAAIWPYGKRAVLQCGDNLTILICDLSFPKPGNTDSWSEDLVFGNVIEHIQSEKFFAHTTWVCFEGQAEFSRIATGRFYSVARGFMVSPGAAEGEGQHAVLLSAINPIKFPSSMIQSKVMRRVADETTYDGWNRVAHANLDDHSIRLIVKSKVMGLGCEVIAGGPQITDVLIGPMQDQPGKDWRSCCLSR